MTKQDVFDYYADPAIKKKLLAAVRAGEATILRQNFTPDQVVLRRKDHRGNTIHLDSKDVYNTWNQQRMTEVHPVFGKNVDFLLADIDPQKKVPWRKTKALVDTVAKSMLSHNDVKSVNLQFSGGRGFYVRGKLKKEMPVNDARRLTKKVLESITARPDVTFGVAKPDQIRIDLSPLKNKGSVKAPYSLSAVTGLVAAPVKLEDLAGVQKGDFTIGKVKTSAAEFAPGIPKSKKIKSIPDVSKPEPTWMMAIQEHNARRAGKHYDLRLVPPLSQDAHSWAIPKARLPSLEDKMLLAVQQPTHKRDYALHFTGTLPQGYGAGTVTMPLKEEVTVLKSGPDRMKFERKNGDQFSMFRTKGNKWGIKKTGAASVDELEILRRAPKKKRKYPKATTAFIRDHMR